MRTPSCFSMSPLLAHSGHSLRCNAMSAFGGKADIADTCWRATKRGGSRPEDGSPDATRECGNIRDGGWFYSLADRQCGLAGRANGPGHPHPPNPLSGVILSLSNMRAFECGGSP